ncbi:MAG: membrane protein insertion efficiency factor YidD [Kiritimatiellales bacterium]|nr:membrane protein insertion efficiency factor YidD [Kiritimatiellales bacterium]
MRKLLTTIWHIPRKTIALLITGYQCTLSPDHGPLKDLYTYGYCRHEPTCSEYGKQIVMKRGAIIGSLLTIIRILSCNPWRKPNAEKIMKTSFKSSQKDQT